MIVKKGILLQFVVYYLNKNEKPNHPKESQQAAGYLEQMNKRGDVVGFTWIELAGIIFAAMLILGTVVFFTRFVSIFYGGDEERATEVAFRTLAVEMNKLLLDNEPCSAVEKLPLFVGSDYAIVGFDKYGGPLINPCKGGERVARPIRPDCKQHQSCLCLYKTDSAFADKTPLSCVSLNINEILIPFYTNDFRNKGSAERSVFKNMGGADVTPSSNKPLPTAGTESLFIFGECDEHWVDEPFGTKVMYVEKSVVNAKSSIYVAYADADTDTAYDLCLKKQKPAENVQASSVVNQASDLMQRGLAKVT